MPYRILQVPEYGVLDAYRARLVQYGFVADAAQQAAVERLQRLYSELLSFKAARRSSWRKMVSRATPPRGVYFWGGVGRGKSFLMDCFFEAVPYRRKRRVHFHAFMREVHERLNTLKGTSDSLSKVADQIAADVRLLCFDEFHVSDIADAMMLGRLLEALFARGVVIVMTSNYPPQRLYPDGLQRENFLPTIALIERELDIVEVDAGVDYRQRTLERVETFLVPADTAAERALAETFAALAGDAVVAAGSLEILGREIAVRRRAAEVIWFDFAELCGGPRSQNDYLDLARRYPTVLLSGIPQMGARHAAEARRFTWLVDVFYDHRVKLIASAACEPEGLYTEGVHAGEFFRTASRLAEMRSRDYLALPHLK
ncbi:cell division protein ZapE [Rhodocyclus tenuis]|uniref:Cell division protein ZapE n=1 Tax=Rhodocyclus gracilis TaxID=2929842 RepID=A0ABX0WE87_9RHOO|nr:cell division protein ZapE [Rhodocyclus gracilis]NJA88047.1 cell division protein ZapE [Rhodocyclus gracilis]